MIAATIHLYDNPEEVGYWGWIESPENHWVIFIDLSRQMQFFRVVDPERPAKIETDDGEWGWDEEQLVGGRGITHSTAVSIILDGGFAEQEILNLVREATRKPPTDS